MRPVHQVVTVVTHCSEAWKRWLQHSAILTCWEHTSQKHKSSQEGTRRNQICKVFLWYLISLHLQRRPTEQNRHFRLFHKTAETTGNHLQVSSDLTESCRNPGGTFEAYCGVWSPGKTSSRTTTLFAKLVADFLCCLPWQDTYRGFISALSARNADCLLKFLQPPTLLPSS